MRLFVAIDLPDAVKDHLMPLLSDTLSVRGLTAGRFASRAQLHLTLRFIGESDRDLIDNALKAVRFRPFEMRLKGVGQFPPRGRARVLWAGLDAPPDLAALAAQVNDALKAAGLPPDDKPFSPHITLARFRTLPHTDAMRAYLNRHAGLAGDPFTIASFVLFASDLQPSGAVYKVQATYAADAP